VGPWLTHVEHLLERFTLGDVLDTVDVDITAAELDEDLNWGRG
jgi:hypothetical protein